MEAGDSAVAGWYNLLEARLGVVGGVVASKFRLGPHCRGSVHLHGRVAMLISGELVVGEVTSDM